MDFVGTVAEKPDEEPTWEGTRGDQQGDDPPAIESLASRV